MPRARQKAKNGAGTVEPRRDAAGIVTWWARVALPRVPGEKLRRKRIPIPESERMTEAQARRAAAKLAREVRDGRILFDDAPSVRAIAAPGSMMSVRQLGEAWTSGELYRRYGAVDGLSPRKSGYIDGITLAKHVYGVKTRGPNGPAFGDLLVSQVTPDDARAVMGAQRPEEQSLQTRRHTYNRLRLLFRFAEMPCKLRPEGSNPVTERLRPRKVKGVDLERNFQYLFPSEAVTLAGCTAVPLARRVFYALAMVTGFDVSTLPGVTWWNYDVRNRVVQAVRPKVGKVGYAEGEPAWLFDLLDAWRDLSGAPAADAPAEALKAAPIVPLDALGWKRGREAEALRADLLTAGITRGDLHEESKTNKRLRFHDLRATFETWARRAGWSQDRIDRRTCHGSRAMGDRYTRAAGTLAELREVPFPNLAVAIPEIRTGLASALAKTTDRTATAQPRATSTFPNDTAECEGGDLNPHASYGASTSSGNRGAERAQGRENPSSMTTPKPLETVDSGVGNVVANADPVENALAEALARASAAGEWAAVAQLAKELEARRVTRPVANVVALDAKRRGRR